MKVVSVDFQMGGDGRTALYLDGKCIIISIEKFCIFNI